MEGEGGGSSSNMNDKRASGGGQEDEVRKGPWTMEEDLILVNYIANHGEGVWNNLARSAGLNRTGKSCRLRWLNYLRPDVRRGNITPQEQLLIMELHARWGNRWSKIARQLPGRTDNEIKNYWRTRIQKRAKQGEAADLMQTAMLVADEPSSNAGGGSGSCLRDGRAAQTTSTQYPGAEQSFLDFGGAPPQFSIDCGDNLCSWDDFWLTQLPDADDCLK